MSYNYQKATDVRGEMSRDILRQNDDDPLKEELEQELKGLPETIIPPFGISQRNLIKIASTSKLR